MDSTPECAGDLRERANRLEAAAASSAQARPALFLCIELLPIGGAAAAVALADLNTEQLFQLTVDRHAEFIKHWRLFRTLVDAETYAANSATLTVMPLVIEHNELLGY